MKELFTFDTITTFDDTLENFENTLLSNHSFLNIFFKFQEVEISLKKVKEILIKNKDNIDFHKIYFYNASDFVNFILKKSIYLPKNINLFINQSCIIGCNFCENKNNSKSYLPFQQIQSFLDKYIVSDNMNFNIIGQGDPIFHPEILDILEYVKSRKGHITLFSGGKSLLLFKKKIDVLDSLVDEYKLNVAASNFEIYNKIHSNPITFDEFEEYKKILSTVGHKSTFITVITKENISDIVKFYELCLQCNANTIEVKQNVFYREGDVLSYQKVKDYLENVLQYILKEKKINLATNIFFHLEKFHNISQFSVRSHSLLDTLINSKKSSLLGEDINLLEKCFQFGNSLDITEKGRLSLCCHYDVGDIGSLSYLDEYSNNSDFREKYLQYTQKKTPESCKRCPMPIDRYKNYLKFNFCEKL